MIQSFECVCGKRVNLAGAIGAEPVLKRTGWGRRADGSWACSEDCAKNPSFPVGEEDSPLPVGKDLDELEETSPSNRSISHDLCVNGELRTLSRTEGVFVPVWAFDEATAFRGFIKDDQPVYGSIAEAIAKARMRGRTELVEEIAMWLEDNAMRSVSESPHQKVGSGVEDRVIANAVRKRFLP